MRLQARGLAKAFGDENVLRDVSFSLPARDTLAILGRSGCGKTTLLKILAGLLPGDAGQTLVDGTDVTSLPPERRGMIYLYQEPLSFPHLDVFENLAFGLRIRRRGEAAIRTAVTAMLEELELGPYARRSPEALSGGQKQRVAFGRALVIEPAVLLLDEPFSALDPETRASMQRLFRKVAGVHAITAVFVTHSVKEAILVGSRFAVLEGGRLSEYPARADFLAAPASGVREEIGFWRGVARDAGEEIA